MKSGTCPKCKSENILVFENKEKDSKTADSEKIGAFGKKIFTTRYVCCDCGYTERYFDDANLEKLKKKFQKIRG